MRNEESVIHEDVPGRAPIDRQELLTRLASDPLVGGDSLTDAEIDAVLDLAGAAARASERSAAPVVAFVAGLALGSQTADQRLRSIRDLIGRIEGG